MSTQPTLFAVEGAVALWRRESPRHKWRLVGTADTGPEVIAMMDGSADYLVRRDGSDPNERPQALTDGEAVCQDD